jgi:hypothetical protein
MKFGGAVSSGVEAAGAVAVQLSSTDSLATALALEDSTNRVRANGKTHGVPTFPGIQRYFSASDPLLQLANVDRRFVH